VREIFYHCDTTPYNVLVSDDEDQPAAVLIDFGIARLVDPGKEHPELRRLDISNVAEIIHTAGQIAIFDQEVRD
jgi:RIO-like serine/threonine protein kinase